MTHHVQGRGDLALIRLYRVKLAEILASKLVQFLILLHVLNLHEVFTDAMNALAVQSALLELGLAHAFNSPPYLNLVYFFGWLSMGLCGFLIRGLRLAEGAPVVRNTATFLRW